MKRSRHRPAAGDIFTMCVGDDRYLYGRVVLADRPRELAPMPGSHLIYIYSHETAEPRPDPILRPSDLLLPPIFINRLPWTTGLFRHLGSRPIVASDLLSCHCFRNWQGRFVDENGRPLSAPCDPCGEWGLAGYAQVDLELTEALRLS